MVESRWLVCVCVCARAMFLYRDQALTKAEVVIGNAFADLLLSSHVVV